MLQVAHILKVRHLVADRRRTNAEIMTPRHSARADRLRRRDVVIDYRLQDALLPFIKHLHTPSDKVYYESPRSQAKAQADWLTFIKGGALLSTKWTFVRVVYYESPRSQARRAQADWLTFIKGGAQCPQSGRLCV